jgi:hypothetical protein
MLAGIAHVMVRKRIRDGGVPPTLEQRIGVFWFGGGVVLVLRWVMGDGC